MKKLFLTLSLVGAPAALLAMQPAQKTINLLVGEDTFEVPQSIAMEAETLKHMAEDLGLAGDLALSAQIGPKAMGLAAQIMWSYYSHKDLKNKALLDAIEKDVSLQNVPLINLLKAFNYLDFPVGLALVARAIAKDQSFLKQFMQDKGLKDLRPLVAKYYYLLHGKNLSLIDEHGKNLINEESYSFSIQEYLDYQPDVLADKWKEDVLNLQNMRLNSLDGFRNIANLDNLRILHLENNQLSILPTEIFNGLTNLWELHLYDNQLNALPAEIFYALANLRELDLGNNKLSALPVKIFNGLANLQGLILNNNQLSMLPEGIFNGLANLRELLFDNNQLSALPVKIFNGLANLERLSLIDNQLSALPAEIFNDLANLQELRLTNNHLSSLPAGIFTGLNNLQWLYLKYNQLHALPKGIFFNTLTNLRGLNLDNNKLSVLLPETFNSLGNLLWLDLSGNQLRRFPVEILNNLTSLRGLHLFNNQLSQENKEDLAKYAVPGERSVGL